MSDTWIIVLRAHINSALWRFKRAKTHAEREVIAESLIATIRKSVHEHL